MLEQSTWFQREPEMLAGCLEQASWLIQYKVKAFMKNKNFLELRLTENVQFKHSLSLHENRKKKTLCLVFNGMTKYWYAACRVPLCRTANCESHSHKSCYTVWHLTKDLTEAAWKIKLYMRLKLDRKKRAQLECGALDEVAQTYGSSSTERANNSSPKRDGR